ncbi:MAG: hypothetical protein ACP5QD_05890, partial [Candidatus Ratteibacteria bacterium]
MKSLNGFKFLFALLIVASFVVHAATVSGPSPIRVRAGGTSSSTAVDYTAAYGTGDSGDFTWTET